MSMHRSSLLFALLAAGWTVAGAGGAEARATSAEEAAAAATPLELKKTAPEELRLKNGIPVYHVRRERLPLVTVRAVVRTGSIWEPADRQGVADLTGRMMRAGGTAAWPADRLDDELDFLAAQLSTDISSEQATVTLNVLSENLDRALSLFAEVLRRPAFEEAKIGVQKDLIKEEIRRQNDSPIDVAGREYQKLVWGENHPRARTPTEETVEALSRADLVDFHGRFFRPGNVMVGVAGNVTRQEVERKLGAALGDWTGAPVEFPQMPAPPAIVPRAAVVHKAVPQSTVFLGHLGPRETDPHRAAGQVMMDILGSGGFTSYITDAVRNDEGLAYFAGGFLSFGGLDHGAMVTIALSKSQTTCKAAHLILAQVERIRETPVTDDELRIARDGILNSQAFEYDSGEEIVADLMDLVYYGLPRDHDERVLERIASITRDDVREAANALVRPELMSVIAVGDTTAMDCAWKTFADELGVTLQQIRLE
jgi:predicted Zn-dependent peptidase